MWSIAGSIPLLLDDGTHRCIYGPGFTPIAQEDAAGTVTYLQSDVIGSVRLATNAAGAVSGTASFSPYGALEGSSGITSSFGFAGSWTDSLTGLDYMRARDYDPGTGQFLSIDPAVDSTRQPYAYAGNNPLLSVDPTGLDAESDAELYNRPYVLLNMMLSLIPGYTLTAHLCSGDDLYTAMVKTYNPMYSVIEGGTNLSNDIQHGSSGFQVAMDTLELASGVAGTAGIAFGGAGIAGSLGRAGHAARSVSAAGSGSGLLSRLRAIDWADDTGSIRNFRYAGGDHPGTSVPFDSNGFPDFSAWRHPDVPDVVIEPTGTRHGDSRAANEAAGLSKTPAGYTWHHSQQPGLMQLIEFETHRDTGHTGGFSIWGRK